MRGRRPGLVLLVLLLARPALARPPGLVDDRPIPPGTTKLGTRDGRKIEPLGDDPAQQMPALRPGGTWLRPPADRVGVHLGYERIGELHYLMLWPQLDVTGEGLALSLGTPVRVEFFNPTVGIGLHGVRSQDWNQLSDVQRILNQLRWRRGVLDLRLSRFERTTLGQGALVRGHEPNLLVGSARLSTLAMATADRGGAELYLDDFANLHVVGVRGFVRPFTGKSAAARTLSLALTGVADVGAPRVLSTFPTGVPRTREDGTFVVARAEAVTGGGVTLESTVIDDGRRALTPFVDHSCIGGRGCGQTVGATLRLGEGSHVDLRLELRRFDAGYVPSYFDSYHEVSRVQLVGAGRGFRSLPKYAALAGDTGGSHLGYLTGVTWVVPGRFAASVAFESSDAPASRALLLHAEVPVWPQAQAIATLERRNLSEGFSALQLGGDDTTGFLGIRVRTVPYLFVNATWFRRFTVNRALGQIESEQGSTADLELTWDL